MRYLIQGLVGLFALLFVYLGFGFVVDPAAAAAGIGLEPTGNAGFSTLRGDIGGLFFGSAALLVYGLIRNNAMAFIAVAVYMGVIATLRLVGFAQEGTSDSAVTAFVVELVMVAVLWFAAKRLPAV